MVNNKIFNKITIIGAGNVGTNLALNLYQRGFCIHQIYNRPGRDISYFAKSIQSKYIDDIAAIDADADLYILSVSDGSISEVASKLVMLDCQYVVHTSGATGLDVLSGLFRNSGVLYPVQTFNINREIDFKNIPICIEASNQEFLFKLRRVSEILSDKVLEYNSEQRKVIHLSAVFVCNFVNYMYTIGYELLQNKGIDNQLLYPLIIETAKKLELNHPSQVQTGPAKRNDFETLNTHQEMLNLYPEYKEIYMLLSSCIISKYN